MSDEVIETCERVRKLLFSRNKHLSIDGLMDEIKGISCHLPDVQIFLRQKKYFKSETAVESDSEYLVLNYISFQIVDGELQRFSDLKECLDAYHQAMDFVRNKDENQHVVICSRANNYEEFSETVSEVAHLCHTMYQVNLFDGILNASAERFRKDLSRTNEFYSNTDILDELSKNYDVKGLELLEIFFDENLGIKRSKTLFKSDIETSLEINELATEIKYAQWNKRVGDGFYRDGTGKKINYAIIPVSETVHRKFDGEREHQFIILFNENDEVDEFLVRFIQVAARHSTEADSRQQQMDVFHLIDERRRALVDEIRRGTVQTAIDRETFLRGALEKILSKVYWSTAAHSVTVRLYDPFNLRLYVFASCVFESGKYKSSPNFSDETMFGGDIGLSETNSVNVRCFLNCAPNQNIYLADIDSDDILNPRHSKSEICFPIWKDNVAIGTMNVESPAYRAFGRDRPFLESVSRMIGDLFGAGYDTIPPEIVSQLAKVNEDAHGLDGADYQDDAALWKNLPITLKTKISAIDDLMENLRKPIGVGSSDKTEKPIEGFLREKIEELLDKTQVKNYDFANCIKVEYGRISSYTCEVLSSIIDAILTNTSHSDIMLDRLQFEVHSQETGYRSLEIRYTSSVPVGCDIANLFGLLPVVKNDETRFGAFLLNNRINAVGGQMIVKRPASHQTGEMPLDISIRIPLEG